MHDHLAGPTWGNVIIIALAGAVALSCIVAMVRMLLRPGENDPEHPKYTILREDR
jgi:hypothetical protein